MRTFLLTMVIGALLVVAGAQLYLPPFMEARVAEGLQKATGIHSLDVRLHTFPAVRLLTGVVGRMAVSADDVMVDDLRIELLHLEARDVRVDMAQLLRGRSFSLRSTEDLWVRLTVTAAALTEYADTRPELPAGIRVDVTERGVELTGRIALLGNTFDAAIIGRFEPDGHTGIVFVPDDISVDGRSLPPFMVAALHQAYTVKVDLGDGPLPIVVEEVIHTAGEFIVVGRPLLNGISANGGRTVRVGPNAAGGTARHQG